MVQLVFGNRRGSRGHAACGGNSANPAGNTKGRRSFEKAAALGKEVQVRQALVEGAFATLMRGAREEHDRAVLAAARELAGQVQMLVLAQASMTRLAPCLQAETGLPVLTSPRLGIEHARRMLDG